MLTNAPRGTKDILPETVGSWQYLETKIRDLCRCYGYGEIRTPTFEHTELFRRGIGEGTDVVDKEMYTFQDRGERSITLRPENTASTVRAYLQNKLYASCPVKLFYIGSMFRYDRPQAGRLREFHQFGVEVLGEASAAVDAEVILLAWDLLKSLGLEDLTVSLNSVGCPKCRPAYRAALQDFFRDKLPELCSDCQSRFERAPLRILDCKVDGGKDFMADAPKITDCLCDECREHFQAVQEYLTALKVNFALDPRLVRGLDYYTKTAFEIKIPSLGAQSAVAGGGRYDGLVKEIGGNDTPAVGFALGMERVLMTLEQAGKLPPPNDKADVFVVAAGDAAKIPAFELITACRRAGYTALMDYAGRSFKSQMKQADKAKAPVALILGEDEVRDSMVTVKNMASSQQEKVPLGEAVAKLAAILSERKGE